MFGMAMGNTIMRYGFVYILYIRAELGARDECDAELEVNSHIFRMAFVEHMDNFTERIYGGLDSFFLSPKLQYVEERFGTTNLQGDGTWS